LKTFLPKILFWASLPRKAGEGVILSSYVVEHHIGSASLRESVAHRLRWTRSTRRVAACRVRGTVIYHAAAAALIACAVAPVWWPVLPLVLLVRMFAAYVVSAHVLRARIIGCCCRLRILVAFGFWLAGFFGKYNSVAWVGAIDCLRMGSLS